MLSIVVGIIALSVLVFLLNIKHSTSLDKRLDLHHAATV